MKTTISAVAVALACAGCANAPNLKNLNIGVGNFQTASVEKVATTVQKVREATRPFTEAEEIELGQQAASKVLGAAPLSTDNRVQHYVNQVGRLLASHTERPDLPWHFAVINDPMLNAFAAPGGYVFITSGLLATLRSEAELAGVLSHEIAHVVRKHQLETIHKAKFKDAVLDTVNSRLSKTVVANFVSGFGDVLFQGLNKDLEFEADRMAVVIAARSGYDPYGLPAVLQGLQTVSPSYGGLTMMFKSHPSFADRLDRLDHVMGPSFDRFENQPSLAPRFKASMAQPTKRGK